MKRDDVKRIARQAIIELVKEERKAKKNCQSYNPYHDSSGKFTNPTKHSGSYSMEKGSGTDGCTYGKSKRPTNSRKRVSTKLPCGRNSKFKCKGGEKYEEHSSSNLIEDFKYSGDEQELERYLAAVIKNTIRKTMAELTKNKRIRSGCSFGDLLRMQNVMSLSKTGEL